ncbi:hypothetical protein F5X99DRAFT_414161 [Biscogniauxia marginata]|nr:hypothetical protein F5X99DRAFT_414161 [Biscogniauxia marginata]
MAIITDVPGLEVLVSVDRKTLKEHDTPKYLNDYQIPSLQSVARDRRNKHGVLPIEHGYTANYIEVQSGAIPCVHFVKHHPKFKRQSDHIAIEVQFDTERLALLHEPDEAGGENWIADTDSVLERGEGGEWKMRKFRFANMNIVEDDERTSDERKIDIVHGKCCGNIRVRVYHMEKSKVKEGLDSYRYQAEPESDTISEKALKGVGVSHHVEWNPRKPPRPSPTWEDMYAHDRQRPFAVFDFKYRSRASLIKMGILTEEDMNADMSREELLAVIRDLRARDKARELAEEIKREVAIKNEPIPDLPWSPVRVMHEAPPLDSPRQFKVQHLENGRELIDLTDD